MYTFRTRVFVYHVSPSPYPRIDLYVLCHLLDTSRFVTFTLSAKIAHHHMLTNQIRWYQLRGTNPINHVRTGTTNRQACTVTQNLLLISVTAGALFLQYAVSRLKRRIRQ
ncbi:MAG: hypothetical protein U0T81_18325 [Saprospiraceae bacterium]